MSVKIRDGVTMQKEAKLRVGDIEDELGVYLTDKNEEVARKLIRQQEKKRFGLRHPWLTGIPTLGIWPAISKARATDAIVNRLMRQNFSENIIARLLRNFSPACPEIPGMSPGTGCDFFSIKTGFHPAVLIGNQK